MQLADLIDLEWLLHDGEPAPGDPRPVRAALEARGVPEGGARRKLDKDRSLREAVALAWLGAERGRHDRLPGRRVRSALRTAGLVLLVVGFLIGVSTAKVLLAYDGTEPVNVLHFVAVMFGLQILLLVLMIWFVLRAGHHSPDAEHGVAHRLIAWIVARLIGKDAGEVSAGLSEVRARRALYADVERWTLFALAQRFGFAFNVGALLTCLFQVAFTDLVFGWATTLDIDAQLLHRIVDALALPWAWLGDLALPSLDVVTASRWDRMTHGFVGGTTFDQALGLSRVWWRFLVAGLCAYGLVPRGLALAFGSFKAKRELAKAPLDHAGFQRLFDALLPSSIGWEGPDAASVRGDAPAPEGAAPARGHAPSEPGAPVWVVAWGRLGERAAGVGELVGRRFGGLVRGAHAAGGASLAEDRATIAALRDARADRVVLVCDAGQQPSKEVVAFVRQVREAIGNGKPIVVGAVDELEGGEFVDPDGGVREAWRRALAVTGDAYLWVERIGGAA